MRPGFLILCGFLASVLSLFGQAAAPVIVTQPESITAYLGESATLTASVTGSPTPTYQWLKAGTAIPGATNTTYTIAAAALTDYAVYHLVATNASGAVTSQGAVIYVTKRPQVITLTSSATTTQVGSSVVLTTSSSVNLPVTLTLVAGSATLSGNLLTGAGGNVVVRASQAGTTTIAAADSVEVTITFVAGAISPFITSAPADLTVTAGATATLRASAIGTPAPTFQWQKDGVALADATGAVLTLPNTTIADSARYTVTATNFVGTSTASATLTVRTPPVLTTSPTSQTAAVGSTVLLTAVATGVPAPTFQWRKNGAVLAGATNATLRFASVATGDAGRFEVVATNAVGTVTSAVALLTVTTRDLTGTFFGQFNATGGTSAVGEFVLFVRANRTAVFLGHLPGAQAGIATLTLSLDVAGNFSQSVNTGTRNATLRGTVDDATGEVTGTLAELGVTLRGARAPRTGTASAQAGFYHTALIGSAAGLGYVVLAADGRAFVLTGSGTIVDSASGALGTNGRLAVTTTSTQAILDLGFTNGTLSGTVRAGTVSGTLAGATEALTSAAHLVNLSVRSTTQNASPLITGFVVNGTTAKQVLIRAAGPSLAQAPFNVAGALANPTLQVFRGNNVVAQNDNWGTPAANAAAITAASARAGAFPFPNNSNDAALVGALTPAPYTVVITGGNGVALAEVYEVLDTTEIAGARRLVNLSARGPVTPAAPLIAGFVITGSAPQRVLLRGVGPTLGGQPFNVPGVLANPQITLFRGATALKTNDDWFRDADAALIRAAAARAGAFALGAQSNDAAILIFLEPGAYTAQVGGPANANNNNGSGVALVEIYEAIP